MSARMGQQEDINDVLDRSRSSSCYDPFGRPKPLMLHRSQVLSRSHSRPQFLADQSQMYENYD